MNTHRKRTGAFGFTLVELLVVVVVLAVFAAILLPRFVGASNRAKQSASRKNLQDLKKAVQQFATDTGAYPAKLTDLTSDGAPEGGLDASGEMTGISASSYFGPYIQLLPTDPVSGKSYVYTTSPPNVGQVLPPGAGSAVISNNAQPALQH